MVKSTVRSIQCLLLLFLMCLLINPAKAQNTRVQKKQAKIAAIKKLVDLQHYTFVAQFANPLGWRAINLNYDYSVVISKDSIVSYLPYYGRAYVAPANPTDPAETGIQFKSKSFDYQIISGKKGGWDVTLIPKDVKETRKFTFNISDEGYTTLNVISNNRQSISFNGYITDTPPITKK